MDAQGPSIQSTPEKRLQYLFPDPLAFGTLVNGVTDAMLASFISQGLNSKEVTRAEKGRRFKILMDWAVILRGDLKWGVQRIIGAMPEILKCELSGVKWTPSQRQCWIPQDGR